MKFIKSGLQSCVINLPCQSLGRASAIFSEGHHQKLVVERIVNNFAATSLAQIWIPAILSYAGSVRIKLQFIWFWLIVDSWRPCTFAVMAVPCTFAAMAVACLP